MAALALGAVGAGVGSFFGYASIGWSIGSALGNYLFAPDKPDIEGPRLTDRSVSGSTYGTMRPLLFGTYRLSGEIIWAADLREYKHKEDTGSKGGGGGGSYTTYTYSASFAMAICEGEISGVRKIWLDNKLVFSAADDADAAQLQVSSKIANGIYVYFGSETQLPDPTIESYLGTGNVPAYRGTAYIVFRDLWVKDYGNRIPQITVEVVKNSSSSIVKTELSSETYAPGNIIEFGLGTYTTWRSEHGSQWNSSYPYIHVETRSLSTGNVLIDDKIGYPTIVGSNTMVPYAVGQKQVNLLGEEYRVWAGPLDFSSTSCFRFIWGVHYLGDHSSFYYGRLTFGGGACDLDALLASTWSPRRQVLINGNHIYMLHRDNGHLYHWQLIFDAEGSPVAVDIPADFEIVRQVTSYNGGFAIDYGNGDIYIADGTNFARYDQELNFIEEKAYFATFTSILAFSVADDLIWVSYALDGINHITSYYWQSGDVAYSSDNKEMTWNALVNNSFSLSVDEYTPESIGATPDFKYHYIFKHALPKGIEPLSSVVEQICNKVGITDDEIGVDDLSVDDVRGYLISQQTPARGALEQLSAAYFFDGRESDGVLDFVKRGDIPTITLDDDDLGCYEGDDVQELADAVRIQEEELPKSLTLNYANIDRDYQTGAQYASRQSVLNGTEATIQLPIAFTDDEAKTIVDKIMFSAWENRHKFTLKTWQAFHKIDAADVIFARGETLRIVLRAEGVNGIIELECVRELPQIYTGQIGSGASAPDTGQSIYVGGPTISYLLDVPPLRDDDAFDSGVYWAADGVMDDWAGAALLRSVDGSTFNTAALTDDDSLTGYSTTALGEFNNSNVFDETNYVRVNVTGVLETKTRNEVLNGGNLAILGDELIQFRTATLVSTGVYDLSGLLRGRIGTDWAMDDHAIGDKFVLLTNSSLRRVTVPSSDLNIARMYASVTSGYTLEDATHNSLTYAANNLKPISPVGIGGGTAGLSTAWTIKWIRRSRYRWQWLDYIDVGIDEQSYDFEVRIHDIYGNVVRTITVSAASEGSDGRFSTTYSNANQITDFGEHQKIINVSVRQVGETRNSEWSDIVQLASGASMSVLLLNMQGTNGSTTITDEYSHTVTANGNAQISTSITPAGDLLLDGTGDYLSIPDSNDWDFGSGDFTIEVNVNFTSLSSSTSLQYFASNYNTAFAGWAFYMHTDNTLRFSNSTSVILSTSFAPSTGIYYHLAISRTAGVLRMFVNGDLIGIVNDTTNISGSAHALLIGANDLTGIDSFMNGHMKWLRITKGIGRYTENFTPPSSPHLD